MRRLRTRPARRARALGGRCRPIFQRKAEEVGEVAGIARYQREAMRQRGTAYHQVEVVNGAA